MRNAARWLAPVSALVLALAAAPVLAADLDGAKAAGQVGERVDGYLGLVDANAPADVKALVEEEKQTILGGDWDVFCGPINDQDGNEKVSDGQCMSDGDMLGMNWFVEGVVGTIPSQ